MREINIKELKFNPFDLLNNWALLTSINGDDYNAMTISWGLFGSLWEKYAISVYVRPQRYTKKYLTIMSIILFLFLIRNIKGI